MRGWFIKKLQIQSDKNISSSYFFQVGNFIFFDLIECRSETQ